MRIGKLILCIVAAATLLAVPAMSASPTEASTTSAAPGAASERMLAATPMPTIPGIVLATSAPAATFTAGELAAAPRYTVKPGESLLAIARAFGVSPSVIELANGLSDPNLLRIGQVLVIPGGRDPAATPSPPTATPVPTTATPALPTATPSPPAPTPTSTDSKAGATPSPAPATGAQSGPPKDPQYFEETGFRIANERFWEFFNRRGGVRTFGYPISKEFLLFGFRVQFFQRLILQLRPDGSVATMNLLDQGLMPYTRVNFSSFPAPDGALAAAAPNPGAEGYFDKLLAFTREKSPDKWSELDVNFYRTFSETVRYEEAYPDKKQDPGIMPAINLELWGAPISAPSFDPANRNFAYLRYQRGIMHYDKTNGTTQGLLLADYLKSIITGWNLPPDLEEQARGSRFYKQYNPLAANGLNRSNELPGTDMRGAFTRDGLVVLDPGHGGSEVGSAHGFADGTIITEKGLNLKVALKTADLLRRAGRQVLLTRTADTRVLNPSRDITGDGRVTLDDDLEARIDVANNAGAELFLSIHFNGSSNPDFKGAEVYYNAKRPFSDKNRKFAQIILDNILSSARAAGFELVNRGVKEDERAVGRGNSLYLLGPVDEIKPRASQMVGALAEGAFLTNSQDAGFVRQEKFLDALATAYAQAVQQYFQSIGK